MVALLKERHLPSETISIASLVFCLSMSFLWVLKRLISSAASFAVLASVAVSRSTADFPDSILPAALMRGPILNTMSSMVRCPGSNPERLIIALSPWQGFSFRRLSPKCARILFSPLTDTRSEAMLTASRSSSESSSSAAMPLDMARACISLKPTPQPDRSSKG